MNAETIAQAAIASALAAAADAGHQRVRSWLPANYMLTAPVAPAAAAASSESPSSESPENAGAAAAAPAPGKRRRGRRSPTAAPAADPEPAPDEPAPKRPRDKWRLDEGLRDCRGRFVPGADGKLIGVALSNRSAPPHFQQTCLDILRSAMSSTSGSSAHAMT